MKVKRYIMRSVPEATRQIRQELGSNAIILSTRQIRSGGILGLFARKMVEVIAAVDDPQPSPAQAQPVAASAASPGGVATAAAMQAASTIAAYAAGRREHAASQRGSSGAAEQASTERSPLSASLTPRQPAAMHGKTAGALSRSVEDEMMQELREMKVLMARFAERSSTQAERWPPLLRRWEEVLLRQDLDPLLTADLLQEVQAERGSELTEHAVYSALKDKLLAIMRSLGSRPIDAGTKMVHFVGPTGVGKTTTIAKLAAEQVLRHRRKVGFITSDTYRIAAVEQLRTYASILHIPLEVAFSPQELTRAYERLSDCDLVFTDTAGRNYRNELFVSELNAMLGSGEDSETILVLSLSMKYNDMKAVTENFIKYKVDKVLFTKLDETSSYGSIVNLVHQFRVPLSYITHGQNVPDDIGEAQEERIVDLILGEPADE